MDQDIHARCDNLRRRSAVARAWATAAREQCISFQHHRATQPEPIGGAIYDEPVAPPTNLHDAAREALRTIRAILDAFPLEWQVAIVKALTACTIVKAHERTQPAPTALSA